MADYNQFEDMVVRIQEEIWRLENELESLQGHLETAQKSLGEVKTTLFNIKRAKAKKEAIARSIKTIQKQIDNKSRSLVSKKSELRFRKFQSRIASANATVEKTAQEAANVVGKAVKHGAQFVLRPKVLFAFGILAMLVFVLTSGVINFHSHEWIEATCEEPEYCKICGKTRGETTSHSWKTATCTKATYCSVCGTTFGSALGHDWQEATCTRAATCRRCGITSGSALGHEVPDINCENGGICLRCSEEIPPLGHNWKEATCIEPKKCRRCGTTEGVALGHVWENASCTQPKTCSICGATEGDLLEHSWEEATCTQPKKCSACGKTDGDALDHCWVEATCSEPKKCSRCGLTEGTSIEHNYIETIIKEASYLSEGLKTRTCSMCGIEEEVTIPQKKLVKGMFDVALSRSTIRDKMYYLLDFDSGTLVSFSKKGKYVSYSLFTGNLDNGLYFYKTDGSLSNTYWKYDKRNGVTYVDEFDADGNIVGYDSYWVDSLSTAESYLWKKDLT